MIRKILWVFLCLGWLALTPGSLAAQAPDRITILFDAFGKMPSLDQDWGFAALVEHDGKRILFDTGNNADIFAHNTSTLKIDLKRLDFVVISHRHGDHTDGLRHLLKINPTVKIYVPDDEYFGGTTPQAFFRRPEPSLPAEMRYFNGATPKEIPHGTPWGKARFIRVDSAMEVMPGVRLVRNIAQTGAFGETPEISLAIDTKAGQVLVVGCSHPGIEPILASVHAKEKPVHLIVGGLHLVTTPDPEVDRLALALRDEWKVESIAPGHCTGEYAFASLRKSFGPKYVYAGVGSVIRLQE